jgi:hypothetical protein
MHTELFSSIRLALNELVEDRRIPLADAFGDSIEQVREFENFEVTECPYADQGLLTANVSFKLAHAVPHDGSVLPESIARYLLESAKVAPHFSGKMGGDGYLNYLPSEESTARFLWEILRDPTDTLTRHSSLLFPGAPVRRLPTDRELAWGAKRIGLLLPKREEARRFHGIVRNRGTASLDDALMFLGLLSKDELDAGAYLRGLAGSENIPWYLTRFESDAGRALKLYEAPLSLEHLHRGFAKQLESLMADSAEHRALRWTLMAREAYLKGVRAGQVDLVFNFLLQGIQHFYVLFNRPENRIPTEDVDSSVFRLVVFAQILLPLKKEIQVRLERSCEVLRSVLIAE